MEKFNKGDKIMFEGHTLYYMDSFTDNDGQNILTCGGLGGFPIYVPEEMATRIESSFEEKALAILADISLSIKDLNENFEGILGAGQENVCHCGDEDDEDIPEDLN